MNELQTESGLLLHPIFLTVSSQVGRHHRLNVQYLTYGEPTVSKLLWTMANRMSVSPEKTNI